MGLPKRRHSNTRTRKRRTHDKLKKLSLTKCSHCGATVLPHHLCSKCGYYKGRQIVVKKQKEKKKKKS
ncbi:MAG: 50S ribosomal protein L32 [Candidatus Omnitrophica bacterium]|nr:50S ribosomal protein L32 [Candidatus Omnitrophota bacterium]